MTRPSLRPSPALEASAAEQPSFDESPLLRQLWLEVFPRLDRPIRPARPRSVADTAPRERVRFNLD